MKRVLIIEDYENLRKLYKEELVEDGYDVICANYGKDAIAKSIKYKPDLIILDIGLQDMNRFELLYKILAINKNLPVIVNSAHLQFIRQDFYNRMVKSFILKSSDLTELKKEIASVMSHK